MKINNKLQYVSYVGPFGIPWLQLRLWLWLRLWPLYGCYQDWTQATTQATAQASPNTSHDFKKSIWHFGLWWKQAVGYSLIISCCCGVSLGAILGGPLTGSLCIGVFGVLTPLAVIGLCRSLGTRDKENKSRFRSRKQSCYNWKFFKTSLIYTLYEFDWWNCFLMSQWFTD